MGFLSALEKNSSSVRPGETSRNLENRSTNRLQDLPVFDFEKVAIATNYFHVSNKLGQGGFGPVYKVMCYIVC